MKLKWTATISGELDVDDATSHLTTNLLNHYSDRELGELFGVNVKEDSEIEDETFWLED